jgi:hypothetical protein
LGGLTAAWFSDFLRLEEFPSNGTNPLFPLGFGDVGIVDGAVRLAGQSAQFLADGFWELFTVPYLMQRGK